MIDKDIKENYDIITNSYLFDKDWYMGEYSNVINEKIDPIYHYLIEGGDKGCNPNSYFHHRYYLEKNVDVKNAGLHPLIHYIKWGKVGKRSISPYFDYNKLSLKEKILLELNDDNPLVSEGVENIIKYDLFDSKWYVDKYGLEEMKLNPLVHYIKFGAQELKNPSPYFNTEFYLNKNSVCLNENINPLIHFSINNFKDRISYSPSNFINEKYSMEDYFEFLNNKIKDIQNQLDYQEEILDSYNNFFDFIFKTDIKANGVLRWIQLLTLEMLKFIIKLCDKYGLRYWLDYGTLIGAIRHKGFVPWDDEIDISMPREDYDVLMKIIKQELKKNPKLNQQIQIVLPYKQLNKIINSDSTYLPTIHFMNKIPHANVDIHVVDYYDISLDNIHLLFNDDSYLGDSLRKFLNNIVMGVYDNWEDAIIEEESKVGIAHKETEFIGTTFVGAYRYPVHVSDIYPLKELYFEGIKFKCPNNPIKWLNSAYYTGDIMKVPKKVHHHNLTNIVSNQLKGKNMEMEFKKVIDFWKNINDSI